MQQGKNISANIHMFQLTSTHGKNFSLVAKSRNIEKSEGEGKPDEAVTEKKN